MEEGEGLDQLIAQRSQRPSYARMVSWEFRDTNDAQVASGQRRRRRRSKQQSGETTQHKSSDTWDDSLETGGHDLGACGQDDLDLSMRSAMPHLLADSETDSSEEYFSAEEFLSYCGSNSCEADTAIGRSEGKENSDWRNSTQNGSGSEEDSSFLEKSLDIRTIGTHYRSPSKKQKRKRRKHYSVTYGNQIMPFMDQNCEDITVCEQTNMDDKIHILKEVPSLVQLCIKSAFKSNLKPHSQLPNSMKRLLQIDDDFSLQKFQLSWLHSTLSTFEPKENFKQNCMYELDTVIHDKYTEKICEMARLLRNAWSETHRLADIKGAKDYKGSKASATLPFTSLGQVSKAIHRRGLATMCVVAATLELMMPPLLSSDAWRHQSQSEGDRVVRVIKSVLARMQYALKSRFPMVVSHCFDDAVPYMLWARGDIQQATEYFLLQSGKTDNEYHEAMYLNEVGRMHALVGATETAVRYYQLALDAVLKDGRNYTHTDEITTQMLMLVANLYDQGLLTPLKGRQSTQAWNCVLSNRYYHTVENLERHVMDTYLCTHCGHRQGRECLEKAKSMLSDLSPSDPRLLYYLSMVHALLGEEKDSYKVYWEYVKGLKEPAASPAGREMVSLSGKGARCNPWLPLVTMVKDIGNSVHFLPVLWRTQLQHLRISNTRFGYESDICSKGLDLHFDSSGNITGNMQMLLPPIRRIKLDPYTGAMRFDQHNSPTKVLTAWDDHNGNEIGTGVFMIPTIHEVYNKDGVRVHLVLGKKGGGMELETDLNFMDLASLIWTGPDGQKARLNIFTKARELAIEDIKQKIHGRTLNPSCRYHRIFYSDAEKLLNLCIKKQRVIDHNWIRLKGASLSGQRVKYLRREKQIETQFRMQYEPKKGREAQPIPDVPFTYVKKPVLKLDYSAHPNAYRIRVTRVTVVGHMLTFVVQQNSESYGELWAVDLASKESFMNVTRYTNFTIEQDGDLKVPNQVGYTIPGTTILPVIYSPKYLLVYDASHIAESPKWIIINSDDIGNCATADRLFVFGSQLLGVSYNSRIWSWSKEKKQRQHSEFTEVRSLSHIGNVLVVSTGKGVSFTSVPRDIDHQYKPLPVVLSSRFTGTPVSVTDDGTIITGGWEKVKVIGTERETRDGEEVYRAAVSLDNTVLVMMVQSDVYGDRMTSNPIEIVMAVTLPGCGTEACFISQQGGVLLVWSQYSQVDEGYREHMFQVGYDAKLMGVLPFLGYGPRSFLPVYLPGDADIQAKHPGHGQAGWYVFMRDGHEGIIGVKLVR